MQGVRRSKRLFPAFAWPEKALRPKVLFGCAAGVMACVLLLLVWLLLDARREAWQQSTRSSENLASALSHDIERTIELFDLSLQAVVDGMHSQRISTLDPELRDGILFDRAATARFLGPIVILDNAGKTMMTSRSEAATAWDFSDRKLFTLQRDDPKTGLYISQPYRDPATGEWVIALSRRLENSYGDFVGVVFGTLRLAFFSQLLSTIDIGSGGTILLFCSNGTLVFQYPFEDRVIGADLSKSSIFPAVSEKSGTFEAVSSLDGIDRFLAFRRVGDLPLVLTVGVTRASVFAEWERKAVAITISMLGLAGMVIVLAIALIAELRRRGRAEREATETSERYRLLADHSLDMIVRLDPRTGERLYVSPGSKRLYGFEPEELIGKTIGELMHPEDMPVWHQAIADIGSNDHRRITYRSRTKDGHYVWVEASVTPVSNPNTGATEIVAIVRDVSERVRYEAALRQAKQQADTANRSKSEFLATMSHELRTPLNAIIGFTEIMQQEVMGPLGNPLYKSYIGDIHSSGTHLLGLINEILDLTKAEAGKLELQEEVFDLSELLRSIMRVSMPRIDQAQLSVETEVQADLPLLRADERKTKQVVFNLVGNAAKFTPAGGKITVSASFDESSGFRVTIADTGIGIATENLQRVLEPFAQIDSSLARRHNGTGLGLSVVKAIMELHGGEIQLESTLGVGTAVTAVFPAELAVERNEARPALTAA